MTDDFEDFINELEQSPANANACSVENPECDACGS